MTWQVKRERPMNSVTHGFPVTTMKSSHRSGWVLTATNHLGRNEVGGKAALPIWIDYMRVALQDVPDQDS